MKIRAIQTSLILFAILFSFNSFSQEEAIQADSTESMISIYIQKSKRPKKIKYLHGDIYYTFHQTISTVDENVEEVTILSSAKILSMDSANLYVAIENEKIMHQNVNGSLGYAFNDYGTSKDTVVLRTIPLKTLDYIEYNTLPREAMYKFGTGLTYVSLSVALIVSPVISYNIVKGVFNPVSYISLTKIGLIGLAAGYPTMKLFETQKHYIKENKEVKERKKWKLCFNDWDEPVR
jgi:hypothetical protein